jgi:hypothetical protein
MEESVPGIAAVVDDVVVGFKDPVREPVLPHEPPDQRSGLEGVSQVSQVSQVGRHITDAELAKLLNIPEEAVKRLDPVGRERLDTVDHQIWLWRRGRGELPAGVIVTGRGGSTAGPVQQSVRSWLEGNFRFGLSGTEV